MLTHEVEKGPKGQSGFTLIELLIVIAIIAILAAIAIPMFLKYKQGAYLDSVRSDVKNTVTAIEAYQATYGVYPTFSGTFGPGPVAVVCPAPTGTTGGTCVDATSSATNAYMNISTGNTITLGISPESCTNGYIVSGTNSNISSGPGSSGKAVSYDSCTGAYTGF